MESKKLMKDDFDVSCMLCLEKHNRVFSLNKKLSETISDVLNIQIENIIKLPKRICYRCFFLVEYLRDFRNITIRNITVAENKLTEDDSSIVYDKPLIFNIITDKVLEEENIPVNLDVNDYVSKEMEEKNNDVLLVPQSYRHADSYEQEMLPFKQSIFQCSRCPNTYNKKTSLVHHERKHKRQERRERIRNTKKNLSKVFKCELCDDETIYSTITELRKHKKSHVRRYCCRMGCGADFNAHFERDFHESTCNDRLSEKDLEQPGVRTRSRSRLSSVSRSRCSSMNSSYVGDNWDSESAQTIHKSKHKSRYARSFSSYDSDISVKTTHTNKQNLLETSSQNKLLNNKSKHKSRYARSFSSYDSDISVKTTHTNKQNLLETSSQNKLLNNKSKHKSRYASSFSSYDSDISVKTTHTNKQNLLETSSQNKLLNNGYESPHSRSSRSRNKRKLSYTESDTEYEIIIEGFQPKNTKEAMYFVKNHGLPDESTRKFRCTKCKFSNNNVDTVSQHETKRHKIQPWYPCPECRKAFTNKQLLDHHRSISHLDGPFICNLCSEVHTSQQNLKIHLHDHRFSKNEECGACDKKFLYIDQLRVHVEGETDERHTMYKLAMQFALSNNEQLDDNFKIVDVISLHSSRPSTPFSENDNDVQEELSENDQSIFNENIIQNNLIQEKGSLILNSIASDKF